MFYKIQTKQAPSYLTSLLLPLSSRSGYTFRKLSYRIPTVSKTSTLNSLYLEQLLCGMPYLLMFNKQAQSMLLRSFSNPILKYTPSTTLVCFLFFFVLFFLIFSSFLFSSLLFLLVMPHTSHLLERSPTSIGLLFLQSCLNICLLSLKYEV